MQRHDQIIQLSDHVKNKLKQHQHSTLQSSFINSSDEFIELNSIDDDDDQEMNPLNDVNYRPRRDTYTIYEMKQPSADVFFTTEKSESILEGKYAKQNECQRCLHQDRIIQLQHNDLVRLYQQNKQLNHQLHSSILLNRQYEDDIEKLKHHLKKTNSHLCDYRINFDQLRQKILSDKNKDSKTNDNVQDKEEDETPIDHIKRLRYEIQMYNRIVAAKEKEQKLNSYLL